MSSFLYDMAAYLAASGPLALTQATNLFIGKLPSDPDICTSIFEYSGQAPEFGLGVSGIAFEWPAGQVICRGPKPGNNVSNVYGSPRSRCEAIWRYLSALQPNTVINSTLYHMIKPQQSPFFLMTDDDERVYIAFNFLAYKEPSA